jgi:hypothetical protein
LLDLIDGFFVSKVLYAGSFFFLGYFGGLKAMVELEGE